jgi:YVTN family beta-propeller protein
MARARGLAFVLAAAVSGCRGSEVELPSLCVLDAGPHDGSMVTTNTVVDGGRVLPSGRLLPDAGAIPGLHLGHPVDMVAHPVLDVVYVADARYGGGQDMFRCGPRGDSGTDSDEPPAKFPPRGIHVVNLDTNTQIQGPSSSDLWWSGTVKKAAGTPAVCADGTLPHDGAFGLAITKRQQDNYLFASSGLSGYVLPFAINPLTGRLTPHRPIDVGGFTAGLALSPDEKSLFVVRFMDSSGSDLKTTSSVTEVPLDGAPDDWGSAFKRSDPRDVMLQGFGAYNATVTPEGADGVRVWVSGFRNGSVQTFARSAAAAPFGKIGALYVGKNPEGIVPFDSRLLDESDGRDAGETEGTRDGGALRTDSVIVAASDSDQLVFLKPPPAPADDPDPVVWHPSIPVGRYLTRNTDLPGASPSEFVVRGTTAYVTLSTDDSVSVVDLKGGTGEHAISVGQSPSAVVITPGGKLVVANGKTPYGPQLPRRSVDDDRLATFDTGQEPEKERDGSAPAKCASTSNTCAIPASNDGSAGSTKCVDTDAGTQVRPDIEQQVYFDSRNEEGSLSAFDLDALGPTLGDRTKKASERILNPVGFYPSPCAGRLFPIPDSPNNPTPIQHVVLIVRENKTYDFLLGDLGRDGRKRPRNGAPQFAVDGIRAAHGWAAITPNLHALAQRYTSLDNFYADAEVSMQGHSWLTTSFVNDYLERIHLEEQSQFYGFAFDQEPGLPGAAPGFGSFFTHLIKNHVSFTIFGEADGLLGSVGDETVLSHVDLGVGSNDKDHSDMIKAVYVADALTCNDAPAFSYVLMPRDHTERITAGGPSPVSLIAENDQATGLLIQRLSEKADLWKQTVVFIVEDDAQQGYDHVDYHRTICVVVSPWAKPEHNSSVHASFPALIHTIETILGIGSMNRFDAFAPILWDAFTANPTGDAFDPFESECARVPLGATNPEICMTPEEEEKVELDDHPDEEQLVFKAVTGSRLGNALPSP